MQAVQMCQSLNSSLLVSKPNNRTKFSEAAHCAKTKTTSIGQWTNTNPILYQITTICAWFGKMLVPQQQHPSLEMHGTNSVPLELNQPTAQCCTNPCWKESYTEL